MKRIVLLAAGDLMSYANTTGLSAWTYNAMLDALDPAGPSLAAVADRPALPPGPYLLVRGLLHLDQRTARLKSCYTLPEGVADPGKVLASLKAAAAQITDALLGGWNHAARIGVVDLSAVTRLTQGVPVAPPVPAIWPSMITQDNPSTWAPAWLGATLPSPANLPPVAKLQAPHHVESTGSLRMTLYGSGSFDPEDGSLRYVWTQLAGPAVTLAHPLTSTPGFSYDDEGPATFRFQLIVNDGQADRLPARVQIDVNPALAQPETWRRDDTLSTIHHCGNLNLNL